MLLNKQQLKKKSAISLQKEYNDCVMKIWATKPVKLEKPIHNGFVKYFVLNNDAKKRADYAKLDKAFDFIGQHKVFCKNRDFLNKKKQLLRPGLKNVPDPRFAHFYSEEKQKEREAVIKELGKYLRYSSDIYCCNCGAKPNEKFIPHYEFNYKELLDEKIDDWYLTHYYPVDGDLKSRVKKIGDKLDREHLWELLYGRHKERGDYSFEDLKAEAHLFYFDIKHEGD